MATKVKLISETITPTLAGASFTGDVNFEGGQVQYDASSNSLDFQDSIYLQLGTDNDLRIYHDGSHARLRETTGDFRIQTTSSGVNALVAKQNAEVEIYHAGAKKIETSSTGAIVTGTLTVTGDLDITGNINSSSVTDLDVEDKTITLGVGQTEAQSGSSGIIIDGSGASILWDETNDVFDFNKGLTTTGNVGIGSTNPSFGSGSGLEIERAGIATLRFQNTTSGKSVELTQDSDFKIESMNSASDIILMPTANVGIGTTSPDSELQIMNNDGSSYRFGYGGSSDVYLDADTVYIRTDNGGANTATFTTTGLGIGTTNPSAKLHISNSSGSAKLKIDTSAAADAGIELKGYDAYVGLGDATNGLQWYIWNDGPSSSSSLKFGSEALSGSNWYADDSQAMVITSSGHIGIGRVPESDIYSLSSISLGNGSMIYASKSGNEPNIDFLDNAFLNSSGVFEYQRSGKSTKVEQYNGTWTFANAPSGTAGATATFVERMRIDADGNVGIGTPNATSTLHVYGTSQLDLMTIERANSTPGLKFVNGADTSGTFGFQLMDNDEYWAGAYDGSNYDYWFKGNSSVFRAEKPVASSTDSGTRQYSHLCTGSFYQSTGAIVIDTNIPAHNVSGNANMLSIKIRGYEYAIHGSIDLNVGCYAGENQYYSANYNSNYIADGWRGNIKFAKNDTTGKMAIILGTTSTVQRCELAVVDFIQGFQNVNESYANGWSMSLKTSLSNYSQQTDMAPRMQSPRPGFHAWLSSNTAFSAGTAARVLASTSFNEGGHYNTSNGRFTAPTEGVYQFNFSLMMNSSSVNQTYLSAEARVNGSTRYIGGWFNKTTGANNNSTTYAAATGSAAIKLSRNDYVEFVCELSNADTAIGGAPGYTYLSGILVG